METVVKPKSLVSGDTIAIVAPSEPIDRSQLLRVERFFTQNGFLVKSGPNILKKIGDYVAGTPAERAADLNWAFSDPEIKAVFVAVGGYGANQLLDSIDFKTIKEHPKIFAGYSDATTLQLAILAKTGLVTFHSPNALRFPEFKTSGYTLSNFWRMVTMSGSKVVVEPQSVWQEIVPGRAEGILFGGNLSSITQLTGTSWDPIEALSKIYPSETKFLFFWEEVSDQFSAIVRNLWHIRNTGFFKRISGMLVGKLTDVAEKDYQDFPPKKMLLREVSASFNFPIIYGVDLGHDVPQMTIPVGINALMDTKSLKLEILEQAVT